MGPLHIPWYMGVIVNIKGNFLFLLLHHDIFEMLNPNVRLYNTGNTAL